MNTKLDESFGVVPVCKVGDEWRIFLIHQKSVTGESYWTLPKGHPEAGESPQETAVRELAEETGFTRVVLDNHHSYTNYYTFTHEGCLIEKSVVYFLGYVEEEVFTLDPTEVLDGGWYSFEVARSVITYETIKLLLDQVEKDLQQVTW